MDWINRVTYKPSRMGNAKKKAIQLKRVVSNWFEEDRFPFWSWAREKEGMWMYDVKKESGEREMSKITNKEYKFKQGKKIQKIEKQDKEDRNKL